MNWGMRLSGLVFIASVLTAYGVNCAEIAIPRRQEKQPNEARTAEAAAAMMTVPQGFSVEVVAAEPDVVNPTAMCLDDRGRFWICESFEYPRREPGPGRDRVRVLEDTDGDGRVDKTTLFLDGLNIPCGVAVGHGGVWISNAPDILFVQDTDGDGRADKTEVVVTGFGRTDTHELPNSLTWGPDGWLYGLNGVFNMSHVKYSPTNPNYRAEHPGWKTTCTLFRIHPKTREFELFCEGTSNPWGLAFDTEGSAFVSACVIDHLWHLTETGYYHRQGGPYPPYTWKIESIVKHKHQKAAYCGLTFYNSDAYPEEYRGKLYMGNIHGGCLNVDSVVRKGATYAGIGHPDFLTANDAWFMPVSQQTGPDGSLYVLDWYDRYHCYQDANADPAGVDRSKGRLYRVRYQQTPRSHAFDLQTESNTQLIARLGSANTFFADRAQRILQERGSAELSSSLIELALRGNGPLPHRLRALFAATGYDWFADNRGTIPVPIAELCQAKEPELRQWGLRILADQGIRSISKTKPSTSRAEDTLELEMGKQAAVALQDDDPRVRLQGMIYVGKVSTDRESRVSFARELGMAIVRADEDDLQARIAWQSLKEHSRRKPGRLIDLMNVPGLAESRAGKLIWPLLVEWSLTEFPQDQTELHTAFWSLVLGKAGVEAGSANDILRLLARKTHTNELRGDSLKRVQQVLLPLLADIIEGRPSSLPILESTLLAVTWQQPAGFAMARSLFKSRSLSDDDRMAAFEALVSAKEEVLSLVAPHLEAKSEESLAFRSRLLTSFGRLDSPEVGTMLVKLYPTFEPELQFRAVDLLTQRAAWGRALVQGIAAKSIPKSAVNQSQVARLQQLDKGAIKELTIPLWGIVRGDRDPGRELVVAEMKRFIRKTPGDAVAGQTVFKKLCGECHKIYGEGAEVGPEITLNGRNDFHQLVSNVFDPNLVIGVGYQTAVVVTADGRVIQGLLVEDNAERVVLKVQGGKQEIISRGQVDEFKLLEKSLMPEGVEKLYTPTEIADLFAFLSLDKPPGDPAAKKLAGSASPIPQRSERASDFEKLVSEVAPGFTCRASGEGGVALLESHAGKSGVLRIHPLNAETPAVLSRKVAIPATGKVFLRLVVSHHPQGDWNLTVSANEETLIAEVVSKQNCPQGWRTVDVDLSKFCGREINLNVANRANGWSNEFGYFADIELRTE